MRPASFWERAAADPGAAAACDADGAPLASRGEVERAARRRLAGEGAAAGAADLLAAALVEGMAPAHRAAAADPAPWVGELALRSWGQLVTVAAHRAGVSGCGAAAGAGFLVPGPLGDPALRLVASWALHAGLPVVVPASAEPGAVGEALARRRPAAAFLPYGIYAVLRDVAATADALAAAGTILVPTRGPWGGAPVGDNVQPVRFGGLGPAAACRAGPSRRAEPSFWERAAAAPDRPALRDDTRGVVLTAGELAGRAWALAEAARALGWQPPPIVVSDLGDFAATVVALLAVQVGGLYWLAPPLGGDVAAFARSAGVETRPRGDGATFLTRPPREPPYVDAVTGAPLAGATIMQTSGSTGPPRWVVHRGLTADPDDAGASAAQMAALFGIPTGGVHAVDNDLLHATFRQFALGALHRGNELLHLGRDRIDPLADRVAGGGVTSLFQLPHRLGALVGALRARGYRRPDPPALAAVIHGGERITPAAKQAAIDLFGPVVNEIYSTTEGNGTCIGSAEWLAQGGSVGWPMPGALVRVDDSGDDDEGDGGGVIRLWTRRTDYLDGSDPLEGWFAPGDRGYLDPATGALVLTGRDSERVTCRGVVVPGRRIATTLEAHPAVAEAAVTVARTADGEHTVAYVIARAPLDPEDLRAWLAGRLAPADLPDRLVPVAELPRLGSGKVDWQALHSGVVVPPR